MQSFLQRFGAVVLGVLHGFDRLRLRGSKRLLCSVRGLRQYLWQRQVPLKEFSSYAREITVALCQAIEKPAKEQGLYRYLNSSQLRKEHEALQLAAEHQRTQGLIAVLGCVEPCQVLRVRGNRHTQKLELVVEPGKCQHYYHYFLDPDFGLRYTRLQSWFPFTMHLGLNGREWLVRQLTQAGIDFVQRDNCLPWVQDFAAAQKLLDEQLTMDWPTLLNGWAQQTNPLEQGPLLGEVVPYYWSVQEGEFATAVAFRSPHDLARVYPAMVQHAYATLRSGDVLRFLGARVKPSGQPWKNFDGEVLTSIDERPEGTRVKHQVKRNTLKMYDKQGSVLRLESVLIDVRGFKVYRTKEGDPEGPQDWLRLRKGVADLHRRAEVSQKINERYAASLATVADQTPVREVTKDLGQPTQRNGRRVRALNPLAPSDAALLQAICRGEFQIAGFRNRDLRVLLFRSGTPASKAEQRQQSAKVTRLLGILRAHGLISKIPKTHRYQLTKRGTTVLSALHAAEEASTEKLLQAA